MDGVLKRLDEVLQVLDARLQGLKPGAASSRGAACRGAVVGVSAVRRI